jgi:hypothetical protein
MTWKEDKINKLQENQNIQECEEGKNSTELDREIVNNQEGTARQKDSGRDRNQDTATTISSRRLRKPPSTRREYFL